MSDNYQWDDKCGKAGKVSWQIYNKDCVGLTIEPLPSITRGELADICIRLNEILNAMYEMTS